MVVTGILTVRKISLIFRRLCLIFGNQITGKYTYFLSFRLCVIERELEETFDNFDIVCIRYIYTS